MTDYFEEVNHILSNYTGITISSYIVAILILVVFFILAKLTNFIINGFLAKAAKHTKNNADDHIIEILEMPIFYSVVLIGVYQSLMYVKALNSYDVFFSDVIKSLAIIIWTAAISKIARVFIDEVGVKFAAKTKSSLDDEMMPLFKNIANLLVWFSGIMFIFKIWNIDITPLLASAGIAGFVIAFAAQDTISHLFGGISIYFDKPFKVGDRIQLESGEIGDVLEIGIRSTRIKTFDETVVIMPNSIIASSKIVNYNKPKSKIKVKIDLSFPYDVDVAKVKKLLLGIAGKVEGIEKDPEPSVYFTDFGEYFLKFLLVTWVDNPKKQFSVKTELNERILEALRKEGIKMPYPSQDVYLKEKH